MGLDPSVPDCFVARGSSQRRVEYGGKGSRHETSKREPCPGGMPVMSGEALT